MTIEFERLLKLKSAAQAIINDHEQKPVKLGKPALAVKCAKREIRIPGLTSQASSLCSDGFYLHIFDANDLIKAIDRYYCEFNL